MNSTCSPNSSSSPPGSRHRRAQLPLAQDQRRVGENGRRTARALLFQEARSASPKERPLESLSLPNRRCFFAAHRTLLHKAGVGARSVAPNEPAAEEGPLSHRSLPAQPPDGQSTPSALEVARLKNPHIGLTTLRVYQGVLVLEQHLLHHPAPCPNQYSADCLSSRCTPSHRDRKSTRLNSSHANISYAVFCLKKKKNKTPKFSINKKKIKQIYHTCST